MKTTYLVIPLLLAMFTACVSNPDLDKLSEAMNSQLAKIKELQEKQSNTADVDEMFRIDDEINALRKKAKQELIGMVKEPISIGFLQTANGDMIEVLSVQIDSVTFPKYSISAEVRAFDYSSVSNPFIGLTAADSLNNKLDVGGGIGYSEKLEAGKTYRFVGEIYNPEVIKNGSIILFDEAIKKW